MKDLDYYMSLNYPFTLEQDEDGSYLIIFPDLPGCMTCGASLEEVIELGRDARKCWVESALQDGAFIPEPKAEVDYPDNFKLRLPRTLYKNLANNARVEGVSMNQYCLYLLSNAIASDDVMVVAEKRKSY
jgi:predicted RNase H-like HicB family nuclease